MTVRRYAPPRLLIVGGAGRFGPSSLLDSLVLSRGVVWADLGEGQHESALDLCKVRPADSQGSALHDSNRPGAVAQPRRRLRKGPGSQERRGLQKALDGAVRRL